MTKQELKKLQKKDFKFREKYDNYAANCIVWKGKTEVVIELPPNCGEEDIIAHLDKINGLCTWIANNREKIEKELLEEDYIEEDYIDYYCDGETDDKGNYITPDGKKIKMPLVEKIFIKNLQLVKFIIYFCDGDSDSNENFKASFDKPHCNLLLSSKPYSCDLWMSLYLNSEYELIYDGTTDEIVIYDESEKKIEKEDITVESIDGKVLFINQYDSAEDYLSKKQTLDNIIGQASPVSMLFIKTFPSLMYLLNEKLHLDFTLPCKSFIDKNNKVITLQKNKKIGKHFVYVPNNQSYYKDAKSFEDTYYITVEDVLITSNFLNAVSEEALKAAINVDELIEKGICTLIKQDLEAKNAYSEAVFIDFISWKDFFHKTANPSESPYQPGKKYYGWIFFAK